MKIEIRFQQASQPLVLDDIINAYTKGPMYCVRTKVSTVKYPIMSIFSVEEIEEIEEAE